MHTLDVVHEDSGWIISVSIKACTVGWQSERTYPAPKPPGMHEYAEHLKARLKFTYKPKGNAPVSGVTDAWCVVGVRRYPEGGLGAGIIEYASTEHEARVLLGIISQDRFYFMLEPMPYAEFTKLCA